MTEAMNSTNCRRTGNFCPDCGYRACMLNLAVVDAAPLPAKDVGEWVTSEPVVEAAVMELHRRRLSLVWSDTTTIFDVARSVLSAALAASPSPVGSTPSLSPDDEVPAGYRALPDGVRCRCIKLWRGASGRHYCCRPDRDALSVEGK